MSGLRQFLAPLENRPKIISNILFSILIKTAKFRFSLTKSSCNSVAFGSYCEVSGGFSLRSKIAQNSNRLLQTFKIIAHCLKITPIVFEFWHFSPIFVLLKLTRLVTLFDRKLQVFKNSPK